MPLLPNYLLFDAENRFIAPIAEHDDATIKWSLDKVGTGTISIPGTPSRDIFKACMSVHETTTLIEVQGVEDMRWTGRVHNAEYVDDGGGPALELTLVNDRIWLDAMVALINPAGSLSQQGIAENDTRTGPTETVVKQYITAAAARLGVPVACVPAPPNDPSPIVTLNARMTKLSELIEDVLAPAGFGLEVLMYRTGRPIPARWAGFEPADGTLVVDVVPGVYTGRLAWQQEQLARFSVSSTTPTGYRAITAGEGEGTDRTFTEYIDTTLRDQLGRYALPEIYVDNSGTSGTEAQAGAINPGVASPATAAALAKARGGVSVSFDVEDGQPWYAGVDWWLGHYGTAIIGGERFSSQIGEVELKEQVGKGIVYAPRFGDAFTSRDEYVGEAINRLAADIQRRRAQR